MNFWLKILFSLWVSLLAATTASAQIEKEEDDEDLPFGVMQITNGDTLIKVFLKEVWVYPEKKFRSKRMEEQYWRLAQRVKKVLPYAKKADELLTYYEPEYEKLKTEKEKKKLIKNVEKELMAQYKEEFKRMSINDGKVLIKLIDRETGKTGFKIIKEFRGGFSAAFWQGIAKLFGNNLKDQFEPYGEDFLLDEIARLVEEGRI